MNSITDNAIKTIELQRIAESYKPFQFDVEKIYNDNFETVSFDPVNYLATDCHTDSLEAKCLNFIHHNYVISNIILHRYNTFNEFIKINNNIMSH